MKSGRYLILALAAATSVLSAADPAAGVEAAEKAWARSVVKRDLAALDKILADDLIYAHSTGVIETKADYVGKLRSGAQRYDAIEHSSMTIRTYGDAAVVHCHVHMRGVNPKGPFNDKLMMLHLWVRQGGVWRLAAHQTTKLPSQ